MSRPASVSPVPQAPGLRVALVVSTYHDDITERLATGALEALAAAGVSSSDIERLDVPGAYEIPFGARTAATSGRVDAVVCLGCLIKGETPHFDYIASAVSHGIMEASLSQGTPMAFGVLTVNTLEEAQARVPAWLRQQGLRSGGGRGDDGETGQGVAAPQPRARERGVTRDPQQLRQARESALQMLYGWEMSGDALPEAIAGVRDLQLRPPVAERDTLAVSLAQGTARLLDRIDPLIGGGRHQLAPRAPCGDRPSRPQAGGVRAAGTIGRPASGRDQRGHRTRADLQRTRRRPVRQRRPRCDSQAAGTRTGTGFREPAAAEGTARRGASREISSGTASADAWHRMPSLVIACSQCSLSP